MPEVWDNGVWDDTWVKWLAQMNACWDAKKWASQFKTFKEAWEACNRIDWMLWLIQRSGGNWQVIDHAENIYLQVLPQGNRGWVPYQMSPTPLHGLALQRSAAAFRKRVRMPAHPRIICRRLYG